MKIKLFVIILLVFVAESINAQIVKPRLPRGLESNNLSTSCNSVTINPVSTISKHKTNYVNGRFYFANILECNIDFLQSCTVINNDDNSTIYRLSVSSPNAKSLGFKLVDFQLNTGCELYFYNSDLSAVIGAITEQNNNQDLTLKTAQIVGDSVIIELYVPDNVKVNNFIISKLYYDYADVFSEMQSIGKYQKSSSVCSVEKDINCVEGDDYQDIKHAILRYTCDEDNESYLCTGSLVNNTACDSTPYFYTAAHCVCDEVVARTAVFYFNYEKESCGSTFVADYQTLSGATLIATAPKEHYTNSYGRTSSEKYSTMDFSLLKLSDIPPQSYLPYYAGISLSETENISHVATIHHPQGSYKKISISNSAPYQDSYTEEDIECHYADFCHWHITKWNVGTTEGGSSGAPLLNTNKMIIGDLSGGFASCSSTYDDYFQMISRAWDTYPNYENQLKHWLAFDVDVTEIQPFDPYNVGTQYLSANIEGELNSDSSVVNLSWSTTATSLFETDFEDVKSTADIANIFLANVDMDNLNVNSLPISYDGKSDKSAWVLISLNSNEDYSPYQGKNCVASITTTSSNTNDYLTFPKITIPSDVELTFYAKSIGGTSTLKISQNTKPSRYQTIETLEIGETWSQYSVSLSDFVGSSIYLNINNITSAGEATALLIDNIKVDKKVDETAEENPIVGYQLFCNGNLIDEISDAQTTTYHYPVERNNIYTFYVLNVYEDGGISGIGNSVTFNLKPTPTNDLIPSKNDNLLVFPLPASNVIYVKLAKKIVNEKVEIVDLSGKVVFSSRYTAQSGETIEISLDKISQGAYILSVGDVKKKIIKN